VGQDIVRDDIISFECITKLTYKNCEVTLKRYGKFLEIHVANFSGKGYYTEKAENFIIATIFNDILDHVNNLKPHIEKVYQKTIIDNARKNGKITDIGDY